jgi:hypothetical protein
MANPHKGDVSFDAHGQTFTLCYSANAICEIEDVLDTSIMALSTKLAKAAKDPNSVRMSTIRAVLWGGLREHHPDIDLKAAGDLIPAAGGLMVIMNKISEAFQRAFPTPETKGARPPRGAARAGTG